MVLIKFHSRKFVLGSVSRVKSVLKKLGSHWDFW